MAFCTACGTKLPENAAYCPQCGLAVKPETVANNGVAPEAAAPIATASAATSVIPDNIAAPLCYTFVVAIVLLLVEPYKRNRFIRFHAFQALLFAVTCALLHAVCAIPFVGFFIVPILELGLGITWIVLVIKAYQGQWFKLPVLGDFAEQHAG